MAKYVFPAVFETAEEGGYVITFPNFEGATQGENLADAVEMATDYLNCVLCDYEDEKKEIPHATDICKIKAEKGGFVNMIVADTTAYRDVLLKENNPIKYARKKAKLNIKQLAELLEAPYRTIQDYDNGKTKPSRWVEKLIIEKIESVV